MDLEREDYKPVPVTRILHLPTLPSLLSSPKVPLIYRDLSWLQFNERVLAESRPSSENPLLERVKFLAISASNLDEFFLVRFPSLHKKTLRTRLPKDSAYSLARLKEIRSTLLENIAKFGAKQTESVDALASELESIKVRLVVRARKDKNDLEWGRQLFEKEVLPLLDLKQKLPPSKLRSLGNLQLAVVLPSGKSVPIPKEIPPLLLSQLESGRLAAFFLDDLLQTFLAQAAGETGYAGVIRLTRDSDLGADFDEVDPMGNPDRLRQRITKRTAGIPVRLQYRGDFPGDYLERAMKLLNLRPDQFYPAATTLCLNGLWRLVNEAPKLLTLDPKAMHPATQFQPPKPFQSATAIFDRIKRRDYLLHHPFDAFSAFEQWLQISAEDPKVERIELALYRTGLNSPLVEALVKAAKKKRIRVFVEPRARFDELNNLDVATQLKKAGAEVILGFADLKTHAKVALVTRKEEDGIRYYTHLSTGNYNSATAKLYTDLALFTANPEIGLDAHSFFEAVAKKKLPQGLKQLVPAPTQLHRKLLNHIKQETQAAREGKKTRIIAKVNALVDETVIAALYEASQAGVNIDLIVRGACSLVPGVTKLSRNIRVISIIDRFLEHSRIYYFESQGAMYLSSADWMPRNFYSRLEIAFPVLDPMIFQFIRDVLLPAYLNDNCKARELTQQGTWKRRTRPFTAAPFRAQFFFQELAQKAYAGTPLFDRPLKK